MRIFTAMKKLFRAAFLISAFLFLTAGAHAIDLSRADRLFSSEGRYRECLTELEELLEKAAGREERAAILWRISRACVVIGQTEQDRDGRLAMFTKGIAAGEKAIEAAPDNADCYMWHCANVGRECQLKSLKDQIGALPVMNGDIEKILNGLGRTDYSAAWQALAEIYCNHPFKSNDSAINFMRQAVLTIPAGELRLSTWGFLAKLLSDRNWKASKRASEAGGHSASFKSGYKDNIDRYSRFDGKFGPSDKAPWTSVPLWSISDREEALAIISHAMSLYEKASVRQPGAADEYKQLKELKNRF